METPSLSASSKNILGIEIPGITTDHSLTGTAEDWYKAIGDAFNSLGGSKDSTLTSQSQATPTGNPIASSGKLAVGANEEHSVEQKYPSFPPSSHPPLEPYDGALNEGSMGDFEVINVPRNKTKNKNPIGIDTSDAQPPFTDVEKKAIVDTIAREPKGVVDHQLSFSSIEINGKWAPWIGDGKDFAVWRNGDEAFRVNTEKIPQESATGDSLNGYDRGHKFYDAAGLLNYKGMQKVGDGQAAYVMDYIAKLLRFDPISGKLTPEQKEEAERVGRFVKDATGRADLDLNFGFENGNMFGYSEGMPIFFDPRSLTQQEYDRAMEFLKTHPLASYK